MKQKQRTDDDDDNHQKGSSSSKRPKTRDRSSEIESDGERARVIGVKVEGGMGRDERGGAF